MHNILSFDASSSAITVAIQTAQQCYHFHEIKARQHNQLLLPIIKDLLNRSGLTLNQLDAISIGIGPGSFTGLRIATGTAQGLALGSQLPVIPISSMAIIAQGLIREKPDANRVLLALDAQMGDIYWAGYGIDQAIAYPLIEEQLIKPENSRADPGVWYACGDGFRYIKAIENTLTAQTVTICLDTKPRYPDARDLNILAQHAFAHKQYISAHMLEPRYLRSQSSWKKMTESS